MDHDKASNHSAKTTTTHKEFNSYSEFYPYYLAEHSNQTCRRLHYVGSLTGLTLLIYAIASQTWWLLPLALVSGYAFAWVGHFFFEHNKPATFKYPLYSFMGDWVMLKDMLTGKIKF